jgi:hypothetical protein
VGLTQREWPYHELRARKGPKHSRPFRVVHLKAGATFRGTGSPPQLAASHVSSTSTRGELRIGVRGNPQPYVAGAHRRFLGGRDILLLGVNKAPKLIDLNSLAGEIVENAVLIPSARAPAIDNELERHDASMRVSAAQGACLWPTSECSGRY